MAKLGLGHPRVYANTSARPLGLPAPSASAISSPWEGIQIYHTDLDSTPYSGPWFLAQWGLHRGTTPAGLWACCMFGSKTPNQAESGRYPIGPLTSKHVAACSTCHFRRSVWPAKPPSPGSSSRTSTGAARAGVLLDDISLIARRGRPAPPTRPISITVNAQANRRAISPFIYGTAFANSSQLSDLNFTVNRSGGNNETRYNWSINAHNLDADWYFESYPETSATPGGAADDHVANSKAANALPLITIPMIGWSPKFGTEPRHSLAVIRSRNTESRPRPTHTGPMPATASPAPSGLAITNNDPNDANFPTNATFQQTYVQHLLSHWGASTNGGVPFYIMDNEHSLWQSTHQDIHPIGPTMQEILDQNSSIRRMVKSNDPNALICGPEEWGWRAIFTAATISNGPANGYNPPNIRIATPMAAGNIALVAPPDLSARHQRPPTVAGLFHGAFLSARRQRERNRR